MKKYVQNENFSECCPGQKRCIGHEIEVPMSKEYALKELWARARDFQNWVSGEDYVLPSRNLLGNPVELDSHKDQMATCIRDRFPGVFRNDPDAWRQGGWKRVDLDEAFQVLGLPPIE